MLKNLLSFLFVFLFLSCSGNTYHKNLKPEKAPFYPRWLSAGEIHSDQTSGITFLKEMPGGDEIFLLADDTGGILHLKISNDTVFTITPINFSKEFSAYIDTFPKADFEEIVYDKKNNNVYLSIEGNGNHPERFAGIYRIFFKNNDVFSDTLTGIKKINITPKDLFEKYIRSNIGYEGLAIDDKYLYLGLEGFTQKGIFADSTILFIADKNSGKIIRQVNTKDLGIHTICGLYSDRNNSVYGVDRNNKSFFHITFDSSLNIRDTAFAKIKTNIPNYDSFDYVASIESITMDRKGNIFIVDDPWKTFFVPSQEILTQLDSVTVQRFRDYVPVIFKYSLSN